MIFAASINKFVPQVINLRHKKCCPIRSSIFLIVHLSRGLFS